MANCAMTIDAMENFVRVHQLKRERPSRNGIQGSVASTQHRLRDALGGSAITWSLPRVDG